MVNIEQTLIRLAKPYHAYPNSGQAARSESSHISCDTVRAYVGQVGLVRAKALARAARMTASQEQRARRCFAKKGLIYTNESHICPRRQVIVPAASVAAPRGK